MNHATPLLGGWMECTPLAKKLLTVFPQTPPSKVHPPPHPTKSISCARPGLGTQPRYKFHQVICKNPVINIG